MGFLAPVIAGIGSALASTGAAIGSTLGIGAGAGAAAGTAAAAGGGSLLGALTTVGTLASGALAAKSLLSGAPKAPNLAAPEAPTVTPAAAAPIVPPSQAQSPVSPISLSRNSSLASLAPGLALGGTGGLLGGAVGAGRKTLLGN